MHIYIYIYILKKNNITLERQHIRTSVDVLTCVCNMRNRNDVALNITCFRLIRYDQCTLKRNTSLLRTRKCKGFELCILICGAKIRVELCKGCCRIL